VYYSFQIRAKNKYGWGPFSDTVTILAADEPDAPLVITGSQFGTSSRLSWSLPVEHGSSVIAYEITIQASDLSFTESTNCDGT
jgi:hypothetical protein